MSFLLRHPKELIDMFSSQALKGFWNDNHLVLFVANCDDITEFLKQKSKSETLVQLCKGLKIVIANFQIFRNHSPS